MKMIYQPNGKQLIWGIECTTKVVSEDDAAKLLGQRKDKWYESPLDFPEVKNGKANEG
tara:strand:+ start:345 stop:518 length:174 start_codon:yes stop_codon:yes gene_type:complete